ncbi:MAG: PspC domain-containing protein [Flavobacteriales bacterium]|nr:PspC domain-containing protein [Flavobacteriales bacterium]
MKKTLTANISGTVFHIEEDAYEKLQRYLANIRSRFTGSDGRDEIMADIEARVAELFNERLDGKRQVVSLADVDHVMSVMGQPEDFAEGEATGGTGAAAAEPPPPAGGGKRRFFRDTEDKWVGGVLGGLGAYIGVDPLWFRLAMIVLVMASVGSLIPIYVLLWILVPKAETAADRLQMRGEAVTVDNIKRVVEEGAERMKQSGERVASEARDLGRQWNDDSYRRRNRAADIIAKLMGVLLLVMAFSLLMGLVTGMVGGTVSLWHSTWTDQDTGILDLGELLFASRAQALWFGIGVFTLLSVPVIGLFLAGFRLLLNTRSPRWLGIALTTIWFAAFVPTIWGAMGLASEFKRENSVLTEIELLQPAQGTLYVDALAPADSTGDWSVRFDDGELDVDLEGLHWEDGVVYGGWASLGVERSADTLFHLKVEREAHGVTPKVARGRAENISYNYRQEGDVLLVSPVIRYNAADKLRGQDVRYTLEVPLGKSVFLRPGSEDVIYDIKNVHNIYDGDMLGRTWTMTEQGLLDLNASRNDNATEDKPREVPADTIKAPQPVAAVVYRGTPKARTRPARRPAAVRPAPAPIAAVAVGQHPSLVPNVLALLAQTLY